MGSLPEGFAGGTPQLWDQAYHDDATGSERLLRSAPGRAIIATLLKRIRPRPGEQLVELGCGGSRWLPLLAARSGVRVAGVDFSPSGIELARRLLREASVDDDGIDLGTIDEYVPAHAGVFDMAVSFGLIEHFNNLEGIVSAHMRCVRPGGRIFMSAPNLHGPNLMWAKLVAPDLFEWHQPISAPTVARACLRLGCSRVVMDHLGGVRLFAEPSAKFRGPGWLRRPSILARRAFNGAGEASHRVAPELSAVVAGALLSPYFAVSAEVPG